MVSIRRHLVDPARLVEIPSRVGNSIRSAQFGSLGRNLFFRRDHFGVEFDLKSIGGIKRLFRLLHGCLSADAIAVNFDRDFDSGIAADRDVVGPSKQRF